MREKINFEDDVVMSVGGASGIGKEIANEFAAEGADIAICDIALEAAKETKSEIESKSNRTVTVRETDVSDYDDCTEAVSHVEETLGDIDVMVNTVAITGEGISKPFLEEEPADWKPQMNVTLQGAINISHAVITGMAENGEGGAIINTVSDSYLGHDPNFTVYGSAKAGVATFTKSVAKEVGSEGIRVNAISPGTTHVPRQEEWLNKYHDRIVESYPLGRLGEPVDHANAAIFLASDAADWITGQVLSVNGGYL
jgi:NAD(P)-dependent dehydrogenase (short-subunit alcohol dehydrogenase family)